MLRPAFLLTLAVLLSSTLVPVHAQDNNELAAKAQTVFKTYCYRCHAVEQKVPDYNLLSRENLVQLRGDDNYRYAYVNVEKPEES